MADLSVRVRLNTTSAINSLNRLQTAINRLNNATNNHSNQVNQVARGYRTVQKSVNQVTHAQQQTTAATKDFWRTLRHVASTYMSILALARLTGTAIKQADTYINTRNKLNAMNAEINGDAGVGGYSAKTLEATDEAIQKMYMSSQRVRTSFTSMSANVGKSMTLAGDAFENNIDNAIRFNEIMAETYALSGASSFEINSSMYQLTQALASGILQGDELRSVREGAPMAYKAIERFAQEVYNTTESLKELGSQGKITSDIVVAAILGMGAQADAAFANTQTTFAQAGTMLSNALYNAFIPVFNELLNLLNSETGAAVMNGIMWIINMIAEASLIIVQLVGSVITWIAENWSWLQYVFYTVITALVIWIGKLAVTAVLAAIPVITAWLKAVIPYLLIAAAIVFLIGVIIHLANTAASGAEFIQQVVAILAAFCIAAAIAVAVTTGMTVMFWVFLIIGVVLLIVLAISAAGGEIMGVAYWIWFGIQNVVLWIANLFAACIAAVVAMFKNFGIFFSNLWGDMKALFWDFCASVVDGVVKIAKTINNLLGIFGIKIDTAGLENTVANLRSKADAAGTNVAYEDVGAAWNSGWNTYQYHDLDAKYQEGYAVGQSWADAINGFGGDLQGWTQDVGSGFTTQDVGQFQYDGTALAWNPESMGFNTPGVGAMSVPTVGSSGGASPWLNSTVPTISPVSPSNTDKTLKTGGSTPAKQLAPKLDKIADNTSSTAGNTGAMADSMEMTQEDLEYLRKLATLEWKKEFTTAHIQVDMSNYNTVNNNDDLDGIATRLADKLYEELDAVANGVYV